MRQAQSFRRRASMHVRGLADRLRRAPRALWWRFVRLGPRLRQEEIYATSLENEVGDWSTHLRGRVLNAGAGSRDLSFLGTEVLNQDLPDGLHSGRIDFAGPIHEIPVQDAYFDSVFCNAVLEHVDDPSRVMRELARVCRPGGMLYLAVPFLQPEHLDPGDYQRYTQDGLQKLVRDHGFEVVAVQDMYTVHHTLAWIARLWLDSRDDLEHLLLRLLLVPYLRFRLRTSRERLPAVAPAYRLLARRVAPDPPQGDTAIALAAEIA